MQRNLIKSPPTPFLLKFSLTRKKTHGIVVPTYIMTMKRRVSGWNCQRELRRVKRSAEKFAEHGLRVRFAE